MLVKCPKCGADVVAGAIRCGNCARILVRNKQDVATLRKEMGKVASGDKPFDPEEQKYLDSWMEIQTQQLARRASLLDRTTDMLLNSFVAAMAIVAMGAVAIYAFVVLFPEQAVAIAQNLGLVNQTPMVLVEF